jgi:hypothetical protein
MALSPAVALGGMIPPSYSLRRFSVDFLRQGQRIAVSDPCSVAVAFGRKLKKLFTTKEPCKKRTDCAHSVILSQSIKHKHSNRT